VPARLFALRHVQRAAGSSPRALRGALDRAGWHDLAERAAAITTPRKIEFLLQRIERHRQAGEKVIVFTGFRETLHLLIEAIRVEHPATVVYHGSLTRREKVEAISAFENDAPVLLTTEAAGEGRNLRRNDRRAYFARARGED
jgi:SNF2 family DNA or RNA helicase